MKTSLVLLLTFVSSCALAQIKFEPGYIITNDGQRIVCEIRNVDWKSNPKSFEYRPTGGEAREETITNVSEFGITGGATYRRLTVDIDRSTDMIERMTDNRAPVFASETLFLRLLIDGKAILYGYEDGNLQRFFFSVNQSPVQQLVYKRYLVGMSNGQAAKNETYKQQILNGLPCGTISKKDVERLDYKRDDLMKVFSKFNACDGSTVASSEDIQQKRVTNLTLRPGLTYNALKISDGSTTTDFGNVASFRIGFEVESVLPFNKGLWAITLEPAYQSYSATKGNVSVDYKAFDIGVGLRRYLHIGERNKLYATLGFVYGIPIASAQALKFPLFSLKVSSGVNATLGVGYIMNRFSAELNYAFPRGILGDYAYYTSSYGGPSLILGYRISK